MALSLIGAIAPSIIGGLFARRDQRRADRRAAQEREVALEDDASRFTRLREGAEAAGFNPLTALQYGGTSMGMPSGVAAPLATAPYWQAGAQAAMDEITGAAAGRRAADQLQRRLTELSIEQAEAELAAGVQGFGVQRVFGQQAAPGSNVSVGQGFNARPTGEYSGPMDFGAQIDGAGYPFNPATTDAEVFENRYADIGSNVAGVAIAASDLSYNLGYDSVGQMIEREPRRDADRRLIEGIGFAHRVISPNNYSQMQEGFAEWYEANPDVQAVPYADRERDYRGGSFGAAPMDLTYGLGGQLTVERFPFNGFQH